MPQKYVNVDAVATLLRHRGPTTLPEHPPVTDTGEVVLCIHGDGGNSAEFDALLDQLCEAHSPLAFDLPAHGRSAGIDSLASVEAMAEFTGGLCTKLGLRPPVLVGHSMGGAIALELALRNPDAVRGVVLVGAADRIEVATEELERWKRVTEGKEQRRLRVEHFAPDTPREVFQRAFMEFIKTDPRALYGDLVALHGWTAEKRMADLGVPLLCVTGEHESPAVRERVDALCEALEGVRQVVIPAAGHALPIAHADALAEAVQAFLGELV